MEDQINIVMAEAISACEISKQITGTSSHLRPSQPDGNIHNHQDETMTNPSVSSSSSSSISLILLHASWNNITISDAVHQKLSKLFSKVMNNYEYNNSHTMSTLSLNVFTIQVDKDEDSLNICISDFQHNHNHNMNNNHNHDEDSTSNSDNTSPLKLYAPKELPSLLLLIARDSNNNNIPSSSSSSSTSIKNNLKEKSGTPQWQQTKQNLTKVVHVPILSPVIQSYIMSFGSIVPQNDGQYSKLKRYESDIENTILKTLPLLMNDFDLNQNVRSTKRAIEDVSVNDLDTKYPRLNLDDDDDGPHPLRIFVAGDRSQVGKSSICLGLLGTLISNKFNYPPSSLAYIKPATQCEATQLVSEFCKKHQISSCPVGPLVYYRGFTRAYLNGETDDSQTLLKRISEAVDHISYGKKIVIIDGVGYPAVGSICNTDNVDVAIASGYPTASSSNMNLEQDENCTSIPKQNNDRIPPAVLLVGKSGVGDAVDSYNINASYFKSKNVPVLGVIFNRLPKDGFYSLENCKEAVSSYFQQFKEPNESVFGFIPEMDFMADTRKAASDDTTSEKKEIFLELDMENVQRFVDVFTQHVDVTNILLKAKHAHKSYQSESENKLLLSKNQEKYLQHPNKKHKLASEFKLTRDQIEEAARAQGAASG